MNGGLFYHDVFTELGRERVRFVVVGGVAVNLLVSPVPFNDIEATATVMEAGGQRISVASIDVLLKMKAGTGRPQDESDSVALRQILASEEEND